MKKKVIVVLLISLCFLMACGSNGVKLDNAELQKEEVIERDGGRRNPFIVGDDVDMHYFGYTIQSYGDMNAKLVSFSDGKAVIEYTSIAFGRDNPAYFATDFNMSEYGDVSINNHHIYVYSSSDPTTFSVEYVDQIFPIKEVVIPCGESRQVTYNIGAKDYLALVWYSFAEDGGEHDFIDNDLYGHIAFFKLK